MSEAWADVGYTGAMLISALIPRRLRDAVEPYAPTVGAILALWIALVTVAAITLLLVRA